MAEVNCEACEAIRSEVPELINGFTDDMCSSLQNDTGLKTSSGHDDCTDLENLNDCLVGNMETEIDDYDSCTWKDFMKLFIGNVWTVLKAIICAICGIWTNIHNLWATIRSLCLTKSGNTISLTSNLGTLCSVTVPSEDTWKANTKNDEGYVAKGDGHANQVWSTDASGNPAWRDRGSIDGQAFIRYYRDLGAGDSVPYWENVSDNFHPSALNIYMDSAGASGGSQEADRDYVVIVSNCTNYVGFQEIHGYVTYYSSGDTRSIADIRSHQAQHPVIYATEADDTFANFSWTTSGAILLKKGEHLKVDFLATTVVKGNAQDSDSTRPKIRLHQFVLVWIPVSVEAVIPS